MALTLVATPGATDANAYADASGALAVAAYRVPDPNTVAFGDLSADQQVQALVTATRDIDSTPGLAGSPGTSAQALFFPRTGDGGVLPPAVVSACIELAISYAPLFAAGATDDPLNSGVNGNIKVDKTGPLTTEYFAARDTATGLDRFPPIVQRLLAPFLQATSGWGSATVERAS